jgi:serine/threonine protein kinase
MDVAPLQRYDILHQIGAGGMGQVFLARTRGEHGFQKFVAVKRILPERARDPDFVVRFVAEAKLAVSLAHANIVQVLDLARFGDDLILVMEFVDGADLRTMLSLVPRPAPETVLHIAIEALKGLAYAHRRTDPEGRPIGVVHCDISPSNLLVSYAGEVKLTDFGIAQLLGQLRRGKRDRIEGKYPYLAPELLRGEPADARADLYALAVTV